MHLQVRFEKLDPHTSRLRCTRQPDGKELWMYTPHQPGLPHDLLHYLVETELGIEAAMYGQMLSSEAIHAHPVTGMFVGYDTGNQDSVNTETIAGSVVVLLNSSVTWPSHSGSSGVTLTMMPQRA